MEELVMQYDISTYGNQRSGSYKGINWSMKRPYGNYWCGYIYPNDDDISDKDIKNLEEIAHGGLTMGYGFDCTHLGDYPMDKNGTFRTFEYVYKCITSMIDYLHNR